MLGVARCEADGDRRRAAAALDLHRFAEAVRLPSDRTCAGVTVPRAQQDAGEAQALGPPAVLGAGPRWRVVGTERPEEPGGMTPPGFHHRIQNTRENSTRTDRNSSLPSSMPTARIHLAAGFSEE